MQTSSELHMVLELSKIALTSIKIKKGKVQLSICYFENFFFLLRLLKLNWCRSILKIVKSQLKRQIASRVFKEFILIVINHLN